MQVAIRIQLHLQAPDSFWKWKLSAESLNHKDALLLGYNKNFRGITQPTRQKGFVVSEWR
ncbi:hypothetical protein [Lunatimonas salinarum]|uniref:hypothetical protein n=1 Tax=Lunatimonas salinarum TaxID=1774590 RepID=UPI001AE0BEBA|nr:hypothetical protein [Lunatimonas salinarum]